MLIAPETLSVKQRSNFSGSETFESNCPQSQPDNAEFKSSTSTLVKP